MGYMMEAWLPCGPGHVEEMRYGIAALVGDTSTFSLLFAAVMRSGT